MKQRSLCLAATLALCIGGLSVNPSAHASPKTSPPTNEVPSGRAIVIGSSFEVPSTTLGGERRVNVRLPDHYSESGRAFPVLVLLDGGEAEDFLHIAGLTQITAAYGEGQEMIVVGVEGVDRRHDLTCPSSVPEDKRLAPTSGGCAAYRRFLVEELRPWISARYKTNGKMAIIGESLAGLFVLETLLRQPSAFDDYIAISPSLWWNGGRLAKEAASHLRSERFNGRRLWVGFDMPAPPADKAAKELALQERLEAALRTAAPSGLSWTAVHVPEGHSTIYHPAALEAIRHLYPIAPAPRK